MANDWIFIAAAILALFVAVMVAIHYFGNL